MADLHLGTLRGHVDLDVAKFDQKYGQVTTLLRRLSSESPELEVRADVTDALGNLERADAAARGLPDAEITVQADTSAAEDQLGDLAETGRRAGQDTGSNLAAGIVGALATIPIAGAVVGIGAAVGSAILDGLENEVRSDLFSARTGLDPQTTAVFARAAGEAYANNFGASIADNMDAARIAVQTGLLDPQATARDAQQVLEQLTGISDLLGEEYPAVARAAAQAIKTGIAGDAAGAFDLLARGTQAGLNVSEDLLDTLNEYGTQFRKVGLEGPQAFGLMAQAVRAGARDTDLAADALKEFSIRAIDGSELTAQSFDDLGLSAKSMSDAIASGGPAAADALDQTLDKLREVVYPAELARIAVGLFGTQAEDLGDALYAMDLSTAVEQLGAVEGAAKSALDTMGDNTAGQIETARRNIELAADGIRGALASAFAPQLEGGASFVTQNREAVMSFLLDASNKAFDLGRSLLEAAAAGTEGFGDFVSTVGPQVLTLIEGVLEGLERIPGVDLDMPGFRAMKADAEAAFSTFDKDSEEAADAIRRNLIENGLDPAQEKLNEVGIPMVAQAAFHDASLALAGDLDGVGLAADGSRLAVETLNGTFDTSTTAGRLLDEQLRGVVAGMDAQTAAGVAAKETQDVLAEKYDAAREALIRQLEAMGYTRAEAENLAAAYGAIPDKVSTQIEADVAQAQAVIDGFIARNRGRVVALNVTSNVTGSQQFRTAAGSVMEGKGDLLKYMADGDLHAEPLDRSLATMVPPGRLRVMVGDRPDVTELFAPLDGSARSHALMAQGAREMGGEYIPMAAGAVVRSGPGEGATAVATQQIIYNLYVTNTGPAPLRPDEVVHALKAHDAIRNPRRG